MKVSFIQQISMLRQLEGKVVEVLDLLGLWETTETEITTI